MSDHDLTYVQAPIMTADHLAAMHEVVRLFPYPGLFDRRLLNDIEAHLQALIAQPVPHTLTPYEVMTHASNYAPPSQTFTSWLKEYDHLDADDCQSDQ